MAKPSILRVTDRPQTRPVSESVILDIRVGSLLSGQYDEIRLDGVTLRSPREVQQFAAWMDHMACRFPPGAE